MRDIHPSDDKIIHHPHPSRWRMQMQASEKSMCLRCRWRRSWAPPAWQPQPRHQSPCFTYFILCPPPRDQPSLLMSTPLPSSIHIKITVSEIPHAQCCMRACQLADRKFEVQFAQRRVHQVINFSIGSEALVGILHCDGEGYSRSWVIVLLLQDG